MTTPGLDELLADLVAEERQLDELVASLPAPAWETPTPAEGWAIRDQVGHLAAGEELAALAAERPDAFAAELERLISDLASTEDAMLRLGREVAPAELLERWRVGRVRTIDALDGRSSRDRIPWVTGDMSVASFVTARLMETFAHGQDVRDSLGDVRAADARLRHVAHLGMQTRAFSYRIRGLPEPTVDVAVALDAAGERFTWGPADAAERVRGSLLDFCLVVTRRRNVADTNLVVEGSAAREWMSIAQAYAGPPTPGRPAGMFPPR